MPVSFSLNVFSDIHSDNYTSNMKQNLRQKKFIVYFQRLTVEILAESNKSEETKVINNLLKIYE